ncbi:hypothetical protein BGE01nite_05990 [Brevifollis gellanilyticus]|uniref:Uncharacterized protein n=2 Tax=Brevifollis gellanilyticus TaxID=748831 RepID=A0A512M3M5_9BACT|nr:hypothetical protein BGE01nite_05990 [Brevifollis gellanilyticus]
MVLTGCLELEEKYLVNPDGSGKFIITCLLDMQKFPGAEGSRAALPSAEEWLQGLVRESKGVDVWASASVESKADGKVFIKAEGYFKSLNRLDFGGPHPLVLAEPALEQAGLKASPLLEPRGFIGTAHLSGRPERPRQLTTRASMIMTALLDTIPPASTPTNEPLETIEGNIGKNLPQLFDVLADARYTALFNFGDATVKSTSGFEQVNPHTVRMDVKLGQLARRADGAHALITSGTKPSQSRTFLLDLLNIPFTRSPSPPAAIIEGEQVVFDYLTESEKAKEAQSPELKRLLAK